MLLHLLTLLHSEQPKLHRVLAVLSATRLTKSANTRPAQIINSLLDRLKVNSTVSKGSNSAIVIFAALVIVITWFVTFITEKIQEF